MKFLHQPNTPYHIFRSWEGSANNAPQLIFGLFNQGFSYIQQVYQLTETPVNPGFKGKKNGK